jgi:hypothetical protein
MRQALSEISAHTLCWSEWRKPQRLNDSETASFFAARPRKKWERFDIANSADSWRQRPASTQEDREIGGVFESQLGDAPSFRHLEDAGNAVLQGVGQRQVFHIAAGVGQQREEGEAPEGLRLTEFQCRKGSFDCVHCILLVLTVIVMY